MLSLDDIEPKTFSACSFAAFRKLTPLNCENKKKETEKLKIDYLDSPRLVNSHYFKKVFKKPAHGILNEITPFKSRIKIPAPA